MTVTTRMANPSMLRERFAAAAAREPLNDLAPADRRELSRLLETAAELEDLPGRWQAALLAAEGATAPSSCCAHAHARG
jgi:hypothetical protein